MKHDWCGNTVSQTSDTVSPIVYAGCAAYYLVEPNEGAVVHAGLLEAAQVHDRSGHVGQASGLLHLSGIDSVLGVRVNNHERNHIERV